MWAATPACRFDFVEYVVGHLPRVGGFDENGVAGERGFFEGLEASEVRLLAVDEDVDDQPIVPFQVREHLPDRLEAHIFGGNRLLIDDHGHRGGS